MPSLILLSVTSSAMVSATNPSGEERSVWPSSFFLFRLFFPAFSRLGGSVGVLMDAIGPTPLEQFSVAHISLPLIIIAGRRQAAWHWPGVRETDDNGQEGPGDGIPREDHSLSVSAAASVPLVRAADWTFLWSFATPVSRTGAHVRSTIPSASGLLSRGVEEATPFLSTPCGDDAEEVVASPSEEDRLAGRTVPPFPSAVWCPAHTASSSFPLLPSVSSPLSLLHTSLLVWLVVDFFSVFDGTRRRERGPCCCFSWSSMRETPSSGIPRHDANVEEEEGRGAARSAPCSRLAFVVPLLRGGSRGLVVGLEVSKRVGEEHSSGSCGA